MRESIEILIRQRGARVVRRDIEGIGRSARATNQAIDLLKRGLASLGGFYAVRELGRAIDQYNALNNRLSVVSGSVNDVSTAYDELLQIANRTLVPLEESVVLFQRGSIAADQLGASNRDLFQFVETVGQALAIQGGNAQTARGALIQLSQAIGTDIVRAEEFNSILEGAFPIALAAARGIDEAAGSISRLRKMVINGEIESREFFDAIMSQQEELAAQFAKITPTMSQGFNVLRNGWITYVGEMDKALGVSYQIGQTMIWMGNNMEVVGAVAMSTGTALAVAFGPALIRSVSRLTGSVLGLNAAMLLNPVVAFAAAIAGATTYLIAMRNEIMLGTDDVQTMGDLFVVFGRDVMSVVQSVREWLSDLFGPALTSVREFVQQYDWSVVGILRATADFADNWIGIYVGAYEAVKAVWEQLPAAIGNALKSTLQPAADQFAEFINHMIFGLNAMRRALNMDLIEEVKFDLGGNDGAQLRNVGALAGEAFMEGFSQQTAIRDYLEGAIDRSRDVTLRRQYEEYMNRPRDRDRTPPSLPPVDGDGSARTDELLNNLKALIGQYDGVAAAKLELAEAEQTLDQAVSRGLISTERSLDLYDRVKTALQGRIDPMGHLLGQMREEAELLRMTSDEREVAERLRAVEDDLRSKGLIIGEQELTQLRAKIEAMRQLRQMSEAENDILESIRGPQEEYNTKLTALNNLLARGEIELKEYNQQFKELQETLPGASNELDKFAENAARNIQDILADFLFNPFEEGLEGMLQSFRVMVQKLIAEAVAADLTRRLFGSAGGGSGDGWLGTILNGASMVMGGGSAPVDGGFMTQVQTFAGGGYTGNHPRSGGLDGQGGYLAMVHPQETVVDHTQGDRSRYDGVNQNITNNFILEERKDTRTQSQLSLAAQRAQRRATARFGA